jgi:hypothetical protein
MNTLADRLRAALRETAEEISAHHVPALRLDKARPVTGIPGTGRRRWRRSLVPLAAAAAVTAAIAGSLALSSLVHSRPVGSAASAGHRPAPPAAVLRHIPPLLRRNQCPRGLGRARWSARPGSACSTPLRQGAACGPACWSSVDLFVGLQHPRHARRQQDRLLASWDAVRVFHSDWQARAQCAPRAGLHRLAAAGAVDERVGHNCDCVGTQRCATGPGCLHRESVHPTPQHSRFGELRAHLVGAHGHGPGPVHAWLREDACARGGVPGPMRYEAAA